MAAPLRRGGDRGYGRGRELRHSYRVRGSTGAIARGHARPPVRTHQRGDYRGSYELFAERSKRVVSLRQYRAFFEANAPYSIGDYNVSSVEKRGGEATVRAVVLVDSAAGEKSYPITQRLVREEGGWRVVMRDAQVASFTKT